MKKLADGDMAIADGQPESALPELAPRAGWMFIAAYVACYSGLWMALLSPLLVGLAIRVQSIDPAHAGGSLSLIMGVGALLALISNPLFGQLSDRTTSRIGMRRPWLIAGAIGGLIGLAMVARAESVSQVLFGWCIAQLAYNAQLAALMPVMSDQVPQHQRGTVSGLVGLSSPIGMVGGTFLVQALSYSTMAMFLVPAAVAVGTALWLAWVLPDCQMTAARRPRYALRELLGSFWLSPLRFPDFGWVWSSRFLLFAGVSVLLTYQGFYLIEQLGSAPAALPHLILVSTLVQSGVLVLVSAVVGVWSDVIGRRKAFVSGGALIYTLGLLVIAFATSYAWFLVGMAITGAGQGAYLAVDLALMTDVLPERETHAARNLGIFNIATVMPQVLMPALASVVLIATEDTYRLLFVIAAGLVALGAWAIQPVRGVY